jgi:hypothetical protein
MWRWVTSRSCVAPIDAPPQKSSASDAGLSLDPGYQY